MSDLPSQLDVNWYMGPDPRRIEDLDDFRAATTGIVGSFRLEDGKGNKISIRMGPLGVIIVEGQAELRVMNCRTCKTFKSQSVDWFPCPKKPHCFMNNMADWT